MAPWIFEGNNCPDGYALLFGFLGFCAAMTWRLLWRRAKQHVLRSPRHTQLPHLSKEEISALPYPPDLVPGAGRDVDTPYGVIKVFEWGPETGEKVLLMHGISTPCVSLTDSADALVRAGYRVMIFDYFGRGYSDAPVDVPYDARLFATQILLVLASSSLPWTGNDAFHLIGYSLGSGVAVSFTRYFAHMIKSLTLVAGAGLIRRSHVGWKSRLLYSTGMFPEWILRALVRQRIMPGQSRAGPSNGPSNGDANGGDNFDTTLVSRRSPGHTVGSVVAWQIQNHDGFIPAFMSSIRYAPIYEQADDWEEVGRLLAARRQKTPCGVGRHSNSRLPGLLGGRILLVLGASDTVILKDEVLHDATRFLGGDGFETMLLDAGHEVVMTNGMEVVAEVVRFWGH